MAGKEKNVAGNIWREKNGGNILAVNSLGGKFSRRYIFLAGEVEPTPLDPYSCQFLQQPLRMTKELSHLFKNLPGKISGASPAGKIQSIANTEGFVVQAGKATSTQPCNEKL